MSIGLRRVRPTAEELAKVGHRPRVPFVECEECGGRFWGSGLGIGSHRRSKAHNRPRMLRQAEAMDRRAAESTGSDAEWYSAEAARLRADWS